MTGLLRRLVLPILVAGATSDLSAQDLAKASPAPAEPTQATSAPAPSEPSVAASVLTQKNARTLRMGIPGPRGQITDRNGVPFAQNRLVHYLALNFPTLSPVTDAAIVSFARERMALANQLLGKTWDIPDAKLIQHYQHRRWLPLAFSYGGPHLVGLTEEELVKVKPLLDQGLMLQTAYMRVYPKLSTACHIVGYTGMTRPLPVGPINDGDPMFQEPTGRAGLEQEFNEALTGQPGMINLLFDAQGKEMHREILRAPVPGHNVITTLDYNMQTYAEAALKRHAPRGGAMVILDVRTGGILAMASNPGFDLNEFIPGIVQTKYDALDNDPLTPLLGRAFQGGYPPASTFKAVTALGVLSSGKVDSDTYFDCSIAFPIGNIVMHNWNTKSDEGPMNVVTAIKRSCNTWFYQAGIAAGSAPIISMAQRLGYGERTGLPISEIPGFIPTDATSQKRYGHRILSGGIANMAIGQGEVLASPLQVAQGMAAIADGTNMMQVRLVQQIQDIHDHIVTSNPPVVRRQISLDPAHRAAVVKGMVEVVSGDGGTGHAADISYAQIAGKTGTGQWKIYDDSDKSRNVAWFAGFLPASNPSFSFAVLYEGSPGEKVSGGGIAAPIVEEVFTKIYKNAPPDDPLIAASKDIPTAEVIEDEPAMKAEAVEDTPPPPPPVEEPKRGIRGLFRRLFR